MSKTNVLFLCTGNSARSQMAEAFLRQHAGEQFDVYSAGLEPAGINPYTEKVMQEVGIDISEQRSKSLDEYMGKIPFGYLITVCSRAEDRCPAKFPGLGQRLHWPFKDPAAFAGSDMDKLQKFREVRDQIEARIKEWLYGDKTKVLFLCTGNSARSQMAEAFLRKYGSFRFEAYSAGLEPQGVNPYTVRVMEEIGIDISDQYSKDVTEYMGKMHFGYLITVCANAEENCPANFPSLGQRLHWPFDDPAAAEGSDAEVMQKFREGRDQLAQRVKEWVSEQETA